MLEESDNDSEEDDDYKLYLSDEEEIEKEINKNEIGKNDSIPFTEQELNEPSQEIEILWILVHKNYLRGMNYRKLKLQLYIQQCLQCQLKKLVRVKTKQPMLITDTPGASFDKIAMDIVGPLPRTDRGNEYILTMQDQLTKFCMGVPLQNQTSETIAEVFVDRFICVLGAPKAILTDQGRNFVTFHPQSNGSLERSHHALGEYLKQYANEQKEWDKWVGLAMFNYNTCVHEATRHTPYELVFGKIARVPTDEPLVTQLHNLQVNAFRNVTEAKEKSKKHYDKKINPKIFKPGDYVFLLKGPKPGKFGNQYTGPHEVLEILNKNNVRIRIKKNTKVVHPNRLRVSYIKPNG
ncbi:hypothetical protein PUN28_002219 [Cardiocondyla obscurior]|uniref:Integrase catalytic domain-containing protein n=1 Tax=Cardiocondyla obscurior TaxID=286306 RepID=A0AAW2GSW6_9HYME